MSEFGEEISVVSFGPPGRIFSRQLSKRNLNRDLNYVDNFR